MVVRCDVLAEECLDDRRGQEIGCLEDLISSAAGSHADQHGDLLACVQDVRGGTQVLIARKHARRMKDRLRLGDPCGAEPSRVGVQIRGGLLQIHGQRQVRDPAIGERRLHRHVHQGGDAARDHHHLVVHAEVHEHPIEVDLLLVLGS